MSPEGDKLKLEIPEARKAEGSEKIWTIGSRRKCVDRSEDPKEGEGQSVETPEARRAVNHRLAWGHLSIDRELWEYCSGVSV
jgi:hypothetical protein